MSQQLQQLKSAVLNRNGRKLSELLALPVDRSKSLSASDEDVVSNVNGSSPSFFTVLQDDNLGTIASSRVSAIVNMRNNNWSSAIDGALNMYNALLEFLREDSNVWILPVLVRLSNDIRLLAVLVRHCFVCILSYRKPYILYIG